MAEREVGPRIGIPKHYSQTSNNVDNINFNDYIERTPRTIEQTNREKNSASWDYNIWFIAAIVFVVVLIIIIIWYVFKKDETTELQKQLQPCKPPNHPQQGQQQQNPSQSQQSQSQSQQSQSQSQQQNPQKDNHEEMDDEARSNLLKKKNKKNIGPVPGEIPDNPLVVGIEAKPKLTSIPEEEKAPVKEVTHKDTSHIDTSHIDALPDIQVPLVTNRLISNLGLDS